MSASRMVNQWNTAAVIVGCGASIGCLYLAPRREKGQPSIFRRMAARILQGFVRMCNKDDTYPRLLCLNQGFSIHDLFCPITMDLPIDPVTAEDGRVYERTAIAMYFQARNERGEDIHSPITNKKIGEKLLAATQHRNIIEMMIECGAIAGDLAEGWKERSKEKTEGSKEKTEMESLIEKAEQGDVDSIMRVARNYRLGQEGFPQDDKMSFIWMDKAREAGSVIAMVSVGYGLAEGWGVAPNHQKGVLYLRIGAEKGSDAAAFYLGTALADGKYGLTVDKTEAASWLWKSLSFSGCVYRHLNETGKQDARKKLGELGHWHSYLHQR